MNHTPQPSIVFVNGLFIAIITDAVISERFRTVTYKTFRAENISAEVAHMECIKQWAEDKI